MYRVAVEDIKRYFKCPVFFNFYKEDTEKEMLISLVTDDKFSEALENTFRMFYLNGLGGSIMSPYELRQRFCTYYGGPKVDIYKTTEFKTKGKVVLDYRKAAKIMHRFYENHSRKMPGRPIGVNVKYSLQLRDAIVDGAIDVIWSDKEKVYVCKIISDDAHMTDFDTLEAVLACKAFRDMAFKEEESYVIINIMSGKFFHKKYSVNIIKRWLNYINNIGVCIKNDLLVPRITEDCVKCKYRKECLFDGN